MAIHLAKIDKRIARRDQIILLMHRLPDNSWTRVIPSRTVVLDRQYPNLQESTLVLVESEQDKVISVDDAIPVLIETLQNLSLRVLNSKKQETSLKLWRESLEIQAAQIFARTEDIDRREELLKIREKKVKDLLHKLEKPS